MPPPEKSANERAPIDPTLPARRGVVIGILVAALLALALYFFWRGTGIRDEEGRHPPRPAQISD